MKQKNIKNPKKNLKEKYKILSTSWHVQTKCFLENSTLHGVRYIAEKDRPFLEKFMWFACVTIGAIATIVIIISLWEKFQTNPTITGLDTDFHNWDVPFPAITVCQDIPSNISLIERYVSKNIKKNQRAEGKEFILKLTQLSYKNLAEIPLYIDKQLLPEDTDLKELVFGLMNKCEDIFSECVFKSFKYNCCEGFFPVFTENGFCYTFNSRHYERKVPWSKEKLRKFNMQYIKETDIEWALSFKVKDNKVQMPIYILNSDYMAGIDVQPQHIWNYRINKIAFSVKQTYTTEDTRQLSIKQRHCVFPDEIRLKIDRIYTYTGCTRQCRMDNAMKLCDCVPYFYPKTDHYQHCTIDELKCIADNIQDIEQVDHCSCQLGCSNTIYEVEKLNESPDNKPNYAMDASFVSWPMVRYKREVLFGWVDLLVSFGGIAGLFLGFSLLSGVEIIYYFTLRACCMIVKEKDELERIQFNKRSKPPPDYNLSLIPYFVRKPYPGNGLNEVANRFYGENIINHNKTTTKAVNLKNVVILPPFGIEFIN